MFFVEYLDGYTHSGRPSAESTKKESYMTEGKVYTLYPKLYVASVDVSVELLNTYHSIWLHFGPFHSKDEAESWLRLLEDIHLQMEENRASRYSAVNGVSGDHASAEPFVRCSIGSNDTPEVDASFRIRNTFIHPDAPSLVAEKLQIYAIQGLEYSIRFARNNCL